MIRITFADGETEGFVPWFEWNSLAPCVVDPDVRWHGTSTLRVVSHSCRSPILTVDPDLDRDQEHAVTFVARQDVPVGPVPVLVDYVMELDWHSDVLDRVGTRFRLGPSWQACTLNFMVPSAAQQFSVCIGFDPNPSSNAQDHHDEFHVGEMRVW